MKWIVCIVFAMGLFGQEKSTESKEPNQDSYEAEIITVKTLSGDSFLRLSKLLSAFNVRYQTDEKLRTIVVYGPKNVVAQMRKVVDQLDRPGSEAAMGKNIEGEIAFLMCSPKASQGTAPLSSDLEAVARQLRTATSCKNAELWDSAPMHMQEGKSAELTLSRPANIPGITAFTKIFVLMTPEAIIRKDAHRYVRFSAMRFNFRIPYSTINSSNSNGNPLVSTQFQNLETGLSTAGDFKEGQKTVLGKISGAEADTAIFAVITLKVID